MAVLVEGISVIVRCQDICDRYPGGWEAFCAAVPNRTLCYDGEVARVGFMRPVDVEAWVKHLEANGLVFLREGKAVDIVVVDQLRGPTTQCDWAEYGHVTLTGLGRVAACWLAGSELKTLYPPDEWDFHRSLSSEHLFYPEAEIPAHMRFVRSEGNLDVYFDLKSEREVYVGKTGK